MGRFRLRASRRYAVVVLAGSLGGALVACAGVWGIQDRSLDPLYDDASADGGGTSQDGTSGGDDGTAKSDGQPSSDGAGGDSGNSADSPVSASDGGDGGVGPGPEGGGDAQPSCDPCTLATGLNHPWFMTADGQNVYWTEWGDSWGSGNGSVKGCSVNGCPSGATSYAIGLTNPRGIAVDSTNLYFATATYGGVTGGIWSCAVGGCNGSPTLLANAGIPFGVAVDSSFVYWTDNDDGSVHKVAKTAGAQNVVIYDGGSYDDAGDTLSELGQLVVDGTNLYFSDYSEDIISMSTSGSTPLFLGNTVNNGSYGSYFGIVTDPTSVYAGGNGIIMRTGKTTEDSGTTFVNGVLEAIDLKRDPGTGLVYWANFGTGLANDGTVGHFAPDGGSKVMKASLAAPEAVAVSGNYLFWVSYGTLVDGGFDTDPSTGVLFRTAK
jgi:hypothetical protein